MQALTDQRFLVFQAIASFSALLQWQQTLPIPLYKAMLAEIGSIANPQNTNLEKRSILGRGPHHRALRHQKSELAVSVQNLILCTGFTTKQMKLVTIS